MQTCQNSQDQYWRGYKTDIVPPPDNPFPHTYVPDPTWLLRSVAIEADISDFNLYHTYANSLRQIKIMPYYAALKEIGHIYIIEEGQGKAVASIVTDVIRFEGIFRPEEVYEFVHCRQDWLRIKRDVEKALFGLGRDDCLIMWYPHSSN